MRKRRRIGNSFGVSSTLVAIYLNRFGKGWFGYSEEGRFCLYRQPKNTGSRDFKTSVMQRELLAELSGDALRAQFPYTTEVRDSTPGPFRQQVSYCISMDKPRDVLALLYLQICAREWRVPDIKVLSWLCQGRVRRIFIEMLQYLREGGRTSRLAWAPWKSRYASELREHISCHKVTTREFVELLGTEEPVRQIPSNFHALHFQQGLTRLKGTPPPLGHTRDEIVALVMSEDPIHVKYMYSLCKNEATGLTCLVAQRIVFDRLFSHLRFLKYGPKNAGGICYGTETPYLIEAKNIILNNECLTNKRSMHSGLARYRPSQPLSTEDTAWWTKIKFNARYSDLIVLDEVLGQSAVEDFIHLVSLDSNSSRNRFSGLKAAMLSDVLPVLSEQPDDAKIVKEALERECASGSGDTVRNVANSDGVQAGVAFGSAPDYAEAGPLQSRVSRVELGPDNSGPNPACSHPYTAGIPDKFREFSLWSSNGAAPGTSGTRLERDFAIKRRKVDSSRAECYDHLSASSVTQEDEGGVSVKPLCPNAGFVWFNQPDGGKVENRRDDEPMGLLVTTPGEAEGLSLSSLSGTMAPPLSPVSEALELLVRPPSKMMDSLSPPLTGTVGLPFYPATASIDPCMHSQMENWF